MVAANARTFAATLVVSIVVVVVIAITTRALLELRGLPVSAITPALTEELEVAVEALEPGRAHSRRQLPLQSSFWVVIGSADCFRHRQGDWLAVPVALIRSGQQRHPGKREQTEFNGFFEPTARGRKFHVPVS